MGGVLFCEIAQRPSRRGRLLPLGSLRAGSLPRSPPRGRTGAGRGGRDFCEIAQRPYGRGRRLPPGSLRAGSPPRSPPRGRTGAGRGECEFCEIAQQPSRRGRRLPPGSLRAGAPPRSPPRGRTGAGRGGRGFAKSRNDPGLRRGRLLPPGSARTGAQPGKYGHRSQRPWFCEIAQQPSRRDRCLPVGSLRAGAPPRSPPRGRTGAGRGDVVSRNAQRLPGQVPKGMPSDQALEGMPLGLVREGVHDATVWHSAGHGRDRVWSLGRHHPHPGRCATRPWSALRGPSPQAGEVNAAAPSGALRIGTAHYPLSDRARDPL
jgi:hypothetical protein